MWATLRAKRGLPSGALSGPSGVSCRNPRGFDSIGSCFRPHDFPSANRRDRLLSRRRARRPGAGDGPGLRAIESADVILYDNLATPSLLSHAPQGVEIRYVGRKRAEHAYTQEQINQMLVDYARAGKRVVRLKGGDPYLFGRGAEEAEALANAGIRFEVVPGVTSAVGVASYAGIPLTHRGFTSAATFVTGHDVDLIDWSKLGTAETLVIFMGLTTFGEISRRLIEAGRARNTPAAAVRWGTRGDQRTVEGTLETLPSQIRQSGLKPPALIIVGEVVSLRKKLNWFEKLPLFGVSVLVTRAKEQAAGLSARLRGLGAGVIELPAIETRPPDDWGRSTGRSPASTRTTG